MEKLFHEDNIIIIILGHIFNLMILNLLTFICCIPVITIGASLTAMHHVLITEIEGKGGEVIKPFFRSFRKNFMPATIIFMGILGVLSIMASIVILFYKNTEPVFYVISIMAVLIGILVLMVFCYVFPLQATFENTIRRTVYNAGALGLTHIPQSFAMLSILIVYGKLMSSYGQNLLAFFFLFGISIPGWLFMKLYIPILNGLLAEDENKED